MASQLNPDTFWMQADARDKLKENADKKKAKEALEQEKEEFKKNVLTRSSTGTIKWREVTKTNRKLEFIRSRFKSYDSQVQGKSQQIPLLYEFVAACPADSRNEWFAEFTATVYNDIKNVYEKASFENKEWEERCQQSDFGFPKNVKFKWPVEGTNKKKQLPANQYAENVLTWVEDQISNEKFFPGGENAEFDLNFESIVEKILQRLVRVYFIIYSSPILKARLEVHDINPKFRIMLFFGWTYNFLKPQDTVFISYMTDKIKSHYVKCYKMAKVEYRDENDI